jgi:hypothetical protein
MRIALFALLLFAVGCHNTDKEQRALFENEQKIKYNVEWISKTDKELKDNRELSEGYKRVADVVRDGSGAYYDGQVVKTIKIRDSLFWVNDSLQGVNDSLRRIIERQ